jgi:hypothetical protein
MHLAILDRSNRVDVDEVMLALRFGIAARQLDALAVEMIDGSDVPAVRANDGHVFLDLVNVNHSHSPQAAFGRFVARPLLEAFVSV